VRARAVLYVSVVVGFLAGCAGTRGVQVHLVSELQPDAELQSENTVVSAGAWKSTFPGFLLGVQHLDDPTLNRRFPGVSFRGARSANPFTYGNWVDPELGYVPPRFTVFEVAVRTREADRVRLDLSKVCLKTDRGDSLDHFALEGPNSLVSRYQEDWSEDPSLVETAKGLAERALLRGNWLRKGESEGGYLVFPYLDPAVYRVTLCLPVVVEREGVADTVRVMLGFKQKLERLDLPVR